MDPLPLLPALVAALAGSLHCAAMCGGLVVAVGARPRRQLAWHAGRLAAYGALGALAGGWSSALRSVLPWPWLHGVALGAGAVLVVGVGLHLAGLVALPLPAFVAGAFGAARRRVARLPEAMVPAAAGALTALLPCGMLWMGVAMALSTGQVVRGALTMLAFGVGTLPALAGSALLSAPLTRLRARPRGRLVLGALVIGLGLGALGVHARAGLHPPAHHQMRP